MSFQEFYSSENSEHLESEESFDLENQSNYQTTSLNIKHFLSKASECNSKLFENEFENRIEPSEKKKLNEYIPFKKGYNGHININYFEFTETYSENKASQDSFLGKKTERNEQEKTKLSKGYNYRKMIGINFLNKYIKNFIMKMKKECKCIFYFNNFPEKFITDAMKKKHNIYLDYTFEQLIENKELYIGKDPFDYYSTNIKVIEALKLEKNKDIMEKSGYDKILKMTFRNLFNDYLKSNEYKQKIDCLIKNKGKSELKNSNIFRRRFYKLYIHKMFLCNI